MARSLRVPLAAVSMLLLAGPVAADPPSQGNEIQELRREIHELRATLRLMIDLDRERLDMMSRLLNEGAGLADGKSDGPERPSVRAAATTPPRAVPQKGTIAGKVEMAGNEVAWVYVENAGNSTVKGKTIELRQSHHQFDPRWAVFQQGTEVRFPNLDSTYHNVFSNSSNATFDLGIYRLGDPPKSYVFKKPGVSEIFCNMHAGMSATVLVVPNAFFTQVAPDGSFSLAGVPTGRRKVVAWAPHAELVTTWVTVEQGKSVTASLELGQVQERSHLNKEGQPYDSVSAR